MSPFAVSSKWAIETRHAGVIGMPVRGNHRLNRLVAQLVGKNLLPDFFGGAQGYAGINNPPPVLVFQQVEIDVIQSQWQRHEQPINTGGDFAQLAMLGRGLKRVTQHGS